MTRWRGFSLGLLAAVLQVLIPIWAVASVPVPSETTPLCIYHASDSTAPAPDAPTAPRHECCSLCAACGLVAAIFPAGGPSLPRPRFLIKVDCPVFSPSPPHSATTTDTRARAPPLLSPNKVAAARPRFV